MTIPTVLPVPRARALPQAICGRLTGRNLRLSCFRRSVSQAHPKPHWTVDLAHAAGVEIIGDVELFVRERNHIAPDCPFIAITGTNGKSTTTALIALIIKASGRDMQLGGNIGTAILTLEPPQAVNFYVVECSSYQIDLAPSAARRRAFCSI